MSNKKRISKKIKSIEVKSMRYFIIQLNKISKASDHAADAFSYFFENWKKATEKLNKSMKTFKEGGYISKEKLDKIQPARPTHFIKSLDDEIVTIVMKNAVKISFKPKGFDYEKMMDEFKGSDNGENLIKLNAPFFINGKDFDLGKIGMTFKE